MNFTTNLLTKDQIEDITEKQRKKLDLFRSVPDNGQIINYLGKDFVVYKNVFWPSEGSKVLVKNYQINTGETVLDVCTGSGVLAIFSAYNGAEKVVALDISKDAVTNAKENVRRHGFEKVIDVRQSDMFEALKDNEQFDVITGNLPYMDITPSDKVEATMWDSDLQTNATFFKNARKYLKPNGMIYICQANFGRVEEVKKMAKKNGFKIRLIAQEKLANDIKEFYAFELK